MKVTFEKNQLEEIIGDAMCAVSDKNTIPVLEGIFFNAGKSGECVMTTYDTEKGFQCRVKCDIPEPGKYIINAAKLGKIVRVMPDTGVNISVSENRIVTITGGKAKFELHAYSGEDFPSIPELSGENGFTVDASILKKIIGQIFFSIAVTDQRPMLCGAYFEIKDGVLRVVSCDGNRLSLREKECEIENIRAGEEIPPLSFIVPGKALAQIMKLVSDRDEKVTIYLSRKHVIFKFDDRTFFSRLIDSNYIDYDRIIPKTSKITVKTDRVAMISALERASLVTEDRTLGQAKSCVKCEFTGNVLKIYSSSVVGSVYDEVLTEKDGEDLLIGFNCRFLLDALKSADSERIKISINNPLMGIIIEPEYENGENAEKEENGEEKPEKFLYMVCPVKMNE